MAIDTENKRRSVQAYTFGLIRPVTDGTIDAADRAIVAWFYSGIFSGGAGSGTLPLLVRPLLVGQLKTRLN